MNKDINCKWNFYPMHLNAPSRSGEDSTFDHFRKNLSRFIIREFIQNSMDAPIDPSGNTPVRVEIRTGSIESCDYPQLIGSLKERMIACQESCNENENSRNPYTNKVSYLEQLQGGIVPYLVIEDFNTTGMEYMENKQSSFNAGVRQMGASHKGTGHAGGSHGLGKTVGFVASKLNAVYYSTKVKDGSTFGEGVVRLCMHKYKGAYYYADAFYDSHEGYRPDCALEIPEDFRRTEPGTSVFILGTEPTPDDILTMKQEVLRSFWLAIHHKKLIVSVDNEIFDHSNLQNKMLDYYPDNIYGEYDVKSYYLLIEKFNPRPYFINCIIDSTINNSHFIFEAKSSKYPHLEHAILYIFKEEAIRNYTDDRIVCMRDKEMVIEFQRPGTRKGYYGVLICDGEGSQFLRKMENVTHDKWDRNEVKELDADTRNNARYVLNEIKEFLKESVATIFPENDETEYKIPVLNKYIVAAGNRTRSNNGAPIDEVQDTSNDPQAPISTSVNGIITKRIEPQKVGRVVIRRKGGAKKKKEKKVVDGGMDMSTQPVPAPVTPPVTPPTPPLPPNPPVPTPDPNPIPTPPTDPITGEVGHETNKNGSHKPTKGGKHTEDIIAEFRIVPLPTDKGLVHRIVINSDDNYKSCSMVITIAGEDKESTLRFEPINKNYRIVGKDYNVLSDFDLIKGKNFIDIKFEDEDYHSLNIKAYEN